MGNSISSNGASRLKDLVNRPDDPNPEDKLTAEKITAGLGEVASLLLKAKQDITIVAVGGAVNTVLLRSRESTSDVDFFYHTKTRNEDVSAIVKAAEKVAKSLGVDKHWLNNHTALFIQVLCQIHIII